IPTSTAAAIPTRRARSSLMSPSSFFMSRSLVSPTRHFLPTQRETAQYTRAGNMAQVGEATCPEVVRRSFPRRSHRRSGAVTSTDESEREAARSPADPIRQDMARSRAQICDDGVQGAGRKPQAFLLPMPCAHEDASCPGTDAELDVARVIADHPRSG